MEDNQQVNKVGKLKKGETDIPEVNNDQENKSNYENKDIQIDTEKTKDNKRHEYSRLVLTIELFMLILAIVALFVSIFQLRQAIKDSRETESILTRIVSILVEEVEVSEQIYDIQSTNVVEGPRATENALELGILKITQEYLEKERDKLASSILPSPTPHCSSLSIKISELMSIPVPPDDDEEKFDWNEYVELYNYGDTSVNIEGWIIADRLGHPGEIIPWDDKFPGIPVGLGITNKSEIPPNSFALILPPNYDKGDQPYNEKIPSDAIIFTLANTDSIGDGITGVSEGSVTDVLVLYIGTKNKINCIVSTYGTPVEYLEGRSPRNIKDNELDEIPIVQPETGGWGGARRLVLSGTDTSSNWEWFYWNDMTPGYPFPGQSVP